MSNTPETEALKDKWSGDPAATGYIEELEEKCRNFEFQCNGTYEFLRQMQELCHEYLNAKIKAERAREEVLIELEEYRSIAENIGAEKAVSEKEKAIRELEEVREYADKLANGFPDGMLPKDVEVLRNANHDLAQELHDAMEALRKIEDIFVDSDDTYEDWKSMGQIARTFLENKI